MGPFALAFDSGRQSGIVRVPPEPPTSPTCAAGETLVATGNHIELKGGFTTVSLSGSVPVYPDWHYNIQVTGCQRGNVNCIVDADGHRPSPKGPTLPYPGLALAVFGEYWRPSPPRSLAAESRFLIGRSSEQPGSAIDELPTRPGPRRLSFVLNWPAGSAIPGTSTHRIRLTPYYPEKRCKRTPPAGQQLGWLWTSGRYIYTSDGFHWRARGANLHDMRSCNRCAFEATPANDEVIKRADFLIDTWKVNFIRLLLESYSDPMYHAPDQDPPPRPRDQWQDVIDSKVYLDDIQKIVDHITSRGVYVLLSVWKDPSVGANGWPTPRTTQVWLTLAQRFLNNSHVLFGLVNEPAGNLKGEHDALLHPKFQDLVNSIRAAEDAAGTPHHLIAVQGLGRWARRIDVFVAKPIQGDNIVYETHIYNRQFEFEQWWKTPARQIPIIIGEFGPVPPPDEDATMSDGDVKTLMIEAEEMEVPYLAWSFHQACEPNLIKDTSAGRCKLPVLQPTAPFGRLLRDQLALPYGFATSP